MTTTRRCSVAQCPKPKYARGWCQMHYARWRVHGDVDTVKTRLKDLTGQQFGRVVVVSRSPERHGAHPSCIVKCECGNTRTVSGPHLVSGHTKSCGCLRVVADDRSPIRKTYLIYKRNARERGYPFRLPETEFRRITQLPCVYCGGTRMSVTRVGELEFHYNGIDRIDNTKGYVEGNMAPCCRPCNVMKGVMPHEDFLQQVLRIAAQHAPVDIGHPSSEFTHG